MLGLSLGIDSVVTAGVAGPYVPAASSVFVNLTNTATVPLPAGAKANDTVVVSVGHSFTLNGLTWSGANTGIQNLQGSNYNGLSYYGTLAAADITRGNLVFGFSGNGYGIASIVLLPGTHTYIDSGGSRQGTGAASRTVSTAGSVAAGSALILLGSAYLATDATSTSLSTTPVHNQNANASGVCRYGVAGSTGVQSGTINYAGSPGGDYQVIIAMSA